MNILSLFSAFSSLAPKVASALGLGTAIKSLVGLVTDKPLLETFEQLGEHLFPSLAPELRAAAGIVTSYRSNYTEWLQGALNLIVTPSPALDVDGHYGPKTRAAVTQLQTQLGLKADSFAGDITRAAIQLALSTLDASKALPAPAPAK